MKSKVTDIAHTGLLCAVLCILSPFTIPIGPIPVSLSNLGVILCGLFGRKKQGIGAVLLYLLIGCIGVPVFSGARGGIGVLLGPTGGFLIGYIPLVLCTVIWLKTGHCPVIGMFIGMIICYIFGVAWYMFTANASFLTALTTCIIPFIPIDTAKILLSFFLWKKIHTRL